MIEIERGNNNQFPSIYNKLPVDMSTNIDKFFCFSKIINLYQVLNWKEIHFFSFISLFIDFSMMINNCDFSDIFISLVVSKN